MWKPPADIGLTLFHAHTRRAPSRRLDPHQGHPHPRRHDVPCRNHQGNRLMNHRHRKVLHALFAHPVSSNIDPKHVVSVFEDLGATVSHGGSGQMKVTLNGHTHGFHDTQHSLSKDEVAAMRRFLDQAGVDPARDFPL
jgi:hypothetical protein